MAQLVTHKVYFTPKMEEVYKACTRIFLEGGNPTPSRLRELLHKEKMHRYKGATLSGAECKARQQWFIDHGFEYNNTTGRWKRTAKTDEIETELRRKIARCP